MNSPNTDTIACGTCGASNRANARFCRSCGAQVARPDAPQAAAPQAAPHRPSFGERMREAGARFAAWRAARTARERRLTLAGIAGAVALLIAGGAYAEWTPLKLLVFGVEGVDLRNTPIDVAGTDCASSQLTAAGMKNIPLHNGSFTVMTPYPYSFTMVGAPQYGNVSGDLGKSEAHKAVFLADCGQGATKNHVLFVYGARGGALTRLAALTLGSGSFGAVHRMSVEGGVIKVEQITDDANGTATGLIANTYAWLGNALVRTGGENVIGAPVVAATEAASPTGGTLQEASFTYFERQLAPYGTWTRHPRWGNVWKPRNVPADFRPYQNGHWENTDDYGTVWVSNYVWGDIPFHYGRWGYDASYGGWLWAPGYTWAPAWVSWREGGGNVGWLPMVPDDHYDGSGDYPYTDADDYGYAGIPQAQYLSMWVFVPEDRIFAPRIRDVVVRGGYRGAYARSFAHTRYAFDHGRIVNRSFDVARYEHMTGRRIGVAHASALFHHGVPMQSPMRGRAMSMREAAHAGPAFGHGPRGGGMHGAAFAPLGRHGDHMPLGPRSAFGARGTHNAPFGARSAGRNSPFGGSGFAHRTGFGERHSAFGNRAVARSPFGGRAVMGGAGTTVRSSAFGQRTSRVMNAPRGNASFGGSAFGGGARPARTLSAFGGGMRQPAAFGGGFTRPAPMQRQPRVVNQPRMMNQSAPQRCGKRCRR